MSYSWPLLAALLFSSWSGLAVPDEEDEADAPPLVGQPAHFSGAVGTFRLTVRAAPVELQAEDPLTYTVTITAAARPRHAPHRPRLQDFPAFKESFYLEDLGPPQGSQPNDHTWEFSYRLKPKNPEVRAVPGFPFVWYKPGVLPARLGYQTLYAAKVPLTVRTRVEVGSKPDGALPIVAPKSAFVPAPPERVLRREELGRLPGLMLLASLVLLPPVIAACWYLIWQRLYPDAARRARQRRSRAAREALKALRRRSAPVLADLVQDTTAVVARYLRHRFDWTIEEPTPAEVRNHLLAQGVTTALAGQASDFFRECDILRFGTVSLAPPDLTVAATQLILALETERCVP